MVYFAGFVICEENAAESSITYRHIRFFPRKFQSRLKEGQS